MKLFGRTSGYYLFWTGAVYLIAGISLSFSEYSSYATYMAPIWILILMLPFAIPPFGRWLNMSIDWDKNMFDFFKGREERKKDYNVVEFPKPVEMPKVAHQAPQEHYRVGYITDLEMVTLTLISDTNTSMTLSMSNAEVDHLVRLLKAAQRFEDDEPSESE